MPYLEISSDIRLYYEIDDWTDPWTRPEMVVMIHGFTECTEAWRAWVAYLGRRYRVIRFDQLGFGRSSPVASDFTFTTELLVDNVAQIINHVADEPVHVIGAKSGGLVAIELAAMRPDLVKTITLASTPLAPPQPRDWIEHMEQHGMRSWARVTMGARLGSRMPPQGIDWWVEMMGRTALSTARVYLRWVSTINVASDLRRVQCPALVLTTTAPQRAYSRSDLEVYREGLARAEVVAIPIDGYHVAGSAPDECARIALDFLQRHHITKM